MEVYFDARWVGARPIHIVGGGSLGGKLCQELVRKRCPEIHVWDPDVLEARNLFNQPYFDRDVGKPKVDGLVRIAREIDPHSTIVPHRGKVVTGTPLTGIVLSAVDSIPARYEEIWPCVRMNPNVSFLADGRVAMHGGKAFGLNPNNPEHVYRYEHAPHKHESPPIPLPGCKTEFPMPENSSRVATEMLWRLNLWLRFEQGSTDPYMNFFGWLYTPRYAHATEYWDEDESNDVTT